LIKMTVDNARDAGIPVAMCGEVAGDPMAAVLLLALGLDELSMSAFSIPSVKRVIRSVSKADAEKCLNKALSASSGEEVEGLLRRCLGEKLEDT
jgi:phosphoenolpyruvate-protein phosphotransferase (PTS system enzyme I)